MTYRFITILNKILARVLYWVAKKFIRFFFFFGGVGGTTVWKNPNQCLSQPIDTENVILQFIWKSKATRIAKIILKKTKSKVGRTRLPGLKTHFITTVIHAMWEQQRNRHTDQWDRTESRNRLYNMLFDKGAKSSSIKERLPFQEILLKQFGHP